MQDFLRTQPVLALNNSVEAWFERKYPEFLQELKDICGNYSNAGKITLFSNEMPMRCSLPYVKSDGEIVLDETFLSYMWALSYGFMVIFDEKIHGPLTGKQPDHGKGLGHFLDRGYRVLEHGFRLLEGFQRWPQDIPNPENCNESDKYYVEKANGIYMAAADFVLCHELAHLACGHFNKQCEIPKKTLEQEADLCALTWVRKGIGPDRSLTTVGFGAIVALSSPLFLDRRMVSDTHPDKDERIANMMTCLAVEDRGLLWGIAATFFLLWKERFNISLNISSEYETYKELFQDIVCQLQPLKRNAVGDERINNLNTFAILD